ncbi:MAG: class I SAM-dependent methyltransferase [Chloroflexi bacterium]|uniref:class I SAM-dependent methyltransferase n=1 Tax=Candidatus Flexifilum breve TaxID=3140694 RepID=UPI003135E617|nr:class I SAM-dependent methyltransferase [Chloroflexota bacterium]
MNTQSSYDRVAEEYARRVYGELAGKPLDRKLLDWLIEKVGGRGMIADIGCGPGQIARYLSDHGAAACGVDLSPGMLAQARTLNPDLEFTQADMRTLEGIADGACAGISAFYSIIHVPESELAQAFAAFKRVLQPGGVVLLAFHLGAEIKHLDEWWGEPVSVDFIFYSRETIKQKLTEAGFTVEEALERDPYPEVEFASRRGYIFARV